MRSTIEANPFERCGVKCSANPRRRNTPCASVRTISSAHRPEYIAKRMAMRPRTIWASLSPLKMRHGAAPAVASLTSLASQT